jgi:outer membrane protein OmpA-like peptidoglycan-associated protein
MRTKYSLLLAMALVLGIFAPAQGIFKKIKEKVKNTSEQRVENTGDKVGNKAGDKIDAAVDSLLSGSLFKKKNKGKDSKELEAEIKRLKDSIAAANAAKAETAKDAAPATEAAAGKGAVAFSSYGKFDFIPGEKIMAVEDFTEDAVGDFPAKWNTNAGGELVTLSNAAGKWLKAPKSGVFYPEYINELPENFTFEYDMAVSKDFSNMLSGLNLFIAKIPAGPRVQFDQMFDNSAQAGVNIHPAGDMGSSDVWVFDDATNKLVTNQTTLNIKAGEVVHVSVWRQKSRLRVYVNETKVWDLPKAFMNEVKYTLLFGANSFEGELFVSNLRLAIGAPDTRNKLITDGRFVTNGILFDVNKSSVKGESYGVIKEIATVLKDNAGIRVNIVGHTDSDGAADLNMKLSKERAESVKQILVSEFGIDAARLETDGKGSSDPIDKANTPTAKAANRRVEFIKL